MSKSPEHDLQVRCVTWFRYQYPHLAPLFFSVPNGGFRNKAEAGRLKAEGVNAGVSDLILQLPNGSYSSLNIEMKAGSRQREAQEIYQRSIEASGGFYVIVRTYDQFISVVNEYVSTVDVNSLQRLLSLFHERVEQELQKAKDEYKKRIIKTGNQ